MRFVYSNDWFYVFGIKLRDSITDFTDESFFIKPMK